MGKAAEKEKLFFFSHLHKRRVGFVPYTCGEFRSQEALRRRKIFSEVETGAFFFYHFNFIQRKRKLFCIFNALGYQEIFRGTLAFQQRMVEKKKN